MDLSVITVTWNNISTIGEQLNSTAQAADGLEFEQIVVDNNSSDNTASFIENNFKNVVLFKNKINAGFSKANNSAVKNAKGDYFLFLNPDMKLMAHSLKPMIEYLKNNHNVGVLSPRLTNENGNTAFGDGPRRFPKILEILVIFFKLPKLFPNLLNRYFYKDLNVQKIQTVESVRGAFMLVPKKVIESLGHAFDERYFCWFEDVDFCQEIKKMGKDVVYYPLFSATDLVGRSFKNRNIFWKQAIFFGSALKYFLKWRTN